MRAIKLNTDKGLITIAFLCFLFYFLLASLKPEGIFWSLDEGGKLIYIESVLREKNPSTALIYPGKPLDPNYENLALYFYSLKNGEIYSWWQVGFPLLSLPFYKFFGFAGLYILPSIAGALIVFFSAKITKFITKNQNLTYLMAFTVAFCSPVFFYSVTFWEHSLSVASIMMMTYLLLISIFQDQKEFLYISGIMGSLAVFFRTEAILLIAGYWLVLVIIERKKVVSFTLGLGITSLIWGTINYWLMGNPISPNVQAVQSLTNFNGLANVGLKYIPYTLFNAPIISAYSLGRGLLVVGTLLFALVIFFSLIKRFRLFSFIAFIGLCLVCFYVLIQPSMYRSVHGFILICPVVALVFTIYNTKIWKTYLNYFLLSFGGILVFLIGYSLRAWLAAGGLQWGPRYMLALYPLLLIPTLIGVREILNSKNQLKNIVVYFSLIFGLFIGLGFQVRGYVTMVSTMNLYEQSAQELRKLNEEIIVTDCTWMPMVIPDLYWNGNIFTNPPGTTLLENIKNFGMNSYLSIDMLSCNTTYIDEVLELYQKHPGGLVIEKIEIN